MSPCCWSSRVITGEMIYLIVKGGARVSTQRPDGFSQTRQVWGQWLNSTMVYARVHNRTVAEDYYAAMDVVERRLEVTPPEKDQNPSDK
jgi:hypothetical protein